MLSKYRRILITAILLTVLFWVSLKYHNTSQYKRDDSPGTKQPFNRDTNHLIFTKHARCRMQCRDITAEEVKEILHNGIINYTKSELDDNRGPKFALEGYSNESQHLRVIFAPEGDEMVVVTTIDLDKEWPCHCN